MIWAFLLISALGVVLVQLGSYSVWVAVLSFGLKATLMILVIMAIAYFAKPLIDRYWIKRPKIIRGKILKDG